MNLQTQWIVGFTDGEGCFHVSIVKNITMKNKYQVMPEFVVTQHVRDIKILYALKAYFKCGLVKVNHDDRSCYVVKNYKHLYEKIIPFFEKHKLKTTKRIDFEKFRFVVRSMIQGHHLTLEGLQELQKFVKQWRVDKKQYNYQIEDKVQPLLKKT